MNPLHWKKEHRLALCLAVGVGFLIGVIPGIEYASPFYCLVYSGYCDPGAGLRYLALIGWPLFGGGIGAAIIYIWQLMRA